MIRRVLFVTDYLHVPQGGGGAERNTHELCLALLAQGVTPAVSCRLQVDGSLLAQSARLRRRLPPRREFVRDGACGYAVFRGWDHGRVAEVVRRFGPDAIVVQSTHPEPLLAALAACPVPVVLYFHEVEEIGHLGVLRDAAYPLIANSAFTAGRLAERCGLRCAVVRPLIDARHYRTARTPERVLFVNTSKRKGADIAFGLAERRPDIAFEFILSWAHTPPALAEVRGRAARVPNILLRPPTQDMRAVYARAKMLLAPSQWEEAWGRVATEAHVNAIPVLGSDRGGLPEAIGPGGTVVPHDAPIEAWEAALSALWDDPEALARYADAARVYAARPEIQPAAIAAALLEILARAAQVPPPERWSGRRDSIPRLPVSQTEIAAPHEPSWTIGALANPANTSLYRQAHQSFAFARHGQLSQTCFRFASGVLPTWPAPPPGSPGRTPRA